MEIRTESGASAVPTPEHLALAARDASLGVGHIWYQTRCPAYHTYDPAACECAR